MYRVCINKKGGTGVGGSPAERYVHRSCCTKPWLVLGGPILVLVAQKVFKNATLKLV